MTKEVQAVRKITTVVSSIVVVDTLICHALLYSMSDLKAVNQMSMQHCLIWELMLYEFKLGHNAIEAAKIIFCMKGEGSVNHSTVTR